MSKSLEITIPEFAEEVQISSARRKKFFKRGDKIPKKYDDEQRFIWKAKGRFYCLYDNEQKDFVVKNPIAAGTPGTVKISGNEIYARMHERKRMAIVKGIKENMAPYLPDSIDLKFPIMIDIYLYTTPKYCNWDLDNLWIYNKCFQDLLVEKKLIPEDNILYITKPGAPRFFPVVHQEERKMVFRLSEDTNPIVTSHVMYNLDKKEFLYLESDVHNLMPDKFFTIKRGTEGKPGDLYIDTYSKTFFVHMGKKSIIYGGLIKGLGRVYSQCIQMNCHAVVSKEFYNDFKDALRKELLDKGINVFIKK